MELPPWWHGIWVLTLHAQRRMAQRGLSEVELRTMLDRVTGLRPSPSEGRWLLDAWQSGRRWVIVVEPDLDRRVVSVITVFERRRP